MKESLPTSSSPREEVSFEARLPSAASWSIFPLGIAMHFLFSGWLFESCDAPLRLVGLMLARNMVLFGWVLLVLPPNGRRLPGVFGPPSTFEGRELTLLTVWGSLFLGIGLELLGRSLISFAPFDILPIAWPGAGAAILWLALLIIVAPVVEELVFRGVLFRAWRRRWGAVPAALASSALFGALHPTPFGATAFGLLMVLVYTRTQSLRAPVLVHMLHNAVCSLGLLGAWLTNPNGVASPPELGGIGALGGALIASVPLALALPWTIRFVRKGWPTLNAPLAPDAAGTADELAQNVGAPPHLVAR